MVVDDVYVSRVVLLAGLMAEQWCDNDVDVTPDRLRVWSLHDYGALQLR